MGVLWAILAGGPAGRSRGPVIERLDSVWVFLRPVEAKRYVASCGPSRESVCALIANYGLFSGNARGVVKS